MTKPIRVEHIQPSVEWWGGSERVGVLEVQVVAARSPRYSRRSSTCVSSAMSRDRGLALAAGGDLDLREKFLVRELSASHAVVTDRPSPRAPPPRYTPP